MCRLAIALLLALLVAPHKTATANLVSPRTSEKATVISGNVAVRKALNGNIVVLVDKSPDGASLPDGVPDLVFRFAPQKEDSSRYKDVSIDFKQAQVIFQPRRLAVRSKDNHVVVSLSLEESTDDTASYTIYGDQSKDLPDTIRLNRGIGLLRQMPKLLADNSSMLVDIEQDFVIRGIYLLDASGCSAGGKGATECSIDCPGEHGCSVTCSTGFWACCNCPNACTCVEKGLIE